MIFPLIALPYWFQIVSNAMCAVNFSYWKQGYVFLFFFLFIIIFIKQAYKIKKCYNHQVLLYIFSAWEKVKNKLKQSEIEVKMIKMKKHNLCSNWQIVFMSDTDKQTLIDLYEILGSSEVHQIF